MRTTVLLLICCASAAGQSYIANALGSSSSATNTIAPEMLASVEIYQTLPLFPGSGQPQVYIRPAGSMQAVPATVIAPLTNYPVTNYAPPTFEFLVPAGIPQGSAEVIWSYSGQPFQSTNVNVAQSNFELSRNGAGGSAASPGVGLATPARPGQTIALTGSGLGYGTTVTATIGGIPATVLYAGRGTPAGMDQIQVQIPSGVADGCYVPLVLNVGRQVVSSSIGVTSMGAPCRHPLNLSLSDLKNLDSGGSLNVVQVAMSTYLNAAPNAAAYRNEAVSANLVPVPANQLAQQYTPPPITGCSVPAPVFETDFAVLASNPVSANPGDTLALSGPSVTLIEHGPAPFYYATQPAPVDGTVSSPPAALIAAGKWTLSTPGSTDLPASSFSFNLPAPVQLNVPAPLTVARSQDQTLTWNGAGFDPGATAIISLSGHASDGIAYRAVSCTAPAQPGSFTIPAAFLAPFAPNSIGALQISIAPGPAAIPGAAFQTTKSGTLAFMIAYNTSDSRPVDFR